ncbi:MAG: hypothetical protein RL238_1695 [Actinomycetota bacterium]|jgi:DNA-binding NarL/FixJ family response regulator
MVRTGVVTGRALHAALWRDVLGARSGVRVVAAVADVDDLIPMLAEIDVVVVDAGGPAEAARVAQAVNAAATAEGAAVAVVVAEPDATPDEVAQRVRTAEPSMTVLSADALRQARGTLRSTTRRSPVAAYPRLTPREREVLGCLSKGLSTSAIAGELGMSVHTCRGHLRTLMTKLGARSQLEVVAYVGEHGLPE